MPAKSKAQFGLMAMALHHPEKLRKKNKGVLSMGKGSLREYVEGTDVSSLPKKVKKGG